MYRAKGGAYWKKVIKGEWGMPRLLEAKKDVVRLRKAAGICKRDLIRRYPNGTTRLAGGQSHRKVG